MRAIGGILIILVIIIRFIYRAVVTRDLREHPDELYLGLGFIILWALIYLYIYMA